VGSELRITFDIMGRQKKAVSEIWTFESARRFGVRNTDRT
jgi:hypothetical protein